MVYPATTHDEARQLDIQNANQFHQILQGDIDTEIDTYEGLGKIPSVAKAMFEAAAYRLPLDWEEGVDETDLLQPRLYEGNIYVPVFVPAPMLATPDNANWRLYRPVTGVVQMVERHLGSELSGNSLILDNQYVPGNNNIQVFVNRSLWFPGEDFTEVSATRIDFINVPGPDDEIIIYVGQMTTTQYDPSFTGSTLRSWVFQGDGGNQYSILGADSDIAEAYIVFIDGARLIPNVSYTVDSTTDTITFANSYAPQQQISVLGIGQVIVTDGDGDGTLRQELARSTGAEMVGYGAETVASKLLELDNSVASGLAGGAPMWGSIGEGLDNTVVGQFFTVPGTGDDYSILYRHDSGGVATEIGRTSSASYAQETRALVEAPLNVGAANGWIDPFFRHLGIGEDVGGLVRWFGGGGIDGPLDTWEYSDNPIFNGNALRKNTEGSGELSGPIIRLEDLKAVEGETITVRALIVGAGAVVRFPGRFGNASNPSLGTQISGADVATSAIPVLAEMEATVVAEAEYFRIYPYTDTAGGYFDIVALWAGKGGGDMVPVWPNFNDLDYLQLASEKALQVQGDFYSQFREVTEISYDSKTNEITAPVSSTVVRGAPFAGWGSQYTTPASISFNVVSVPSIVRDVPASDAEKWYNIRIEVRSVSDPSETPLTGPVIAYGVTSADPEADELTNVEVGLISPSTGLPITLTEADLGAQFFVGYIALNQDGDPAIAGETRGQASEWNGESLYYSSAVNKWMSYDTFAIAMNLHLAANLRFNRAVVPLFQTGGGDDLVLPDLSLAPFIYQAGDRQINTYFANLTYTDWEQYRWDVTCNRGSQMHECHRLDDSQPAADVSLTIQQQDPNTFDVLTAATSTLRMAVASAGTGVARKLLVIGDSTTANGKMVTEIVNLFGADVMNLTTIGTQGTAPNLHEGHSGWKTTDFTGPGRTFFEFVVTGIVEDPAINATTYDHNGSTYRVQELNLDANGDGMIICERRAGTNDPLASGTLTKSNGSPGDATISFSAWQNVAGNPFWNDGTNQLDFAGYMSANGFTLAANDWVMIHLGINDCFAEISDAGVDALTDAAFPALDNLIASIRAYEPGIRIGMCVPVPPPASQDAFGASYRNTQTRHRFMRNIHRWALNLIDYYGNQEGLGNYLIPLNSCWDTENNAMTVEQNVNSRSPIRVDRQYNGVHPGDNGYLQMADCIYSAIKYHG